MGVEIEEEESIYKSRLERIYNNQQNVDMQWLENKLKYSNQASLRKQIHVMISNLFLKINKFKELFFKNDERKVKKFIDSFIDTRNFYTHSDLESKKNILALRDSLNFCRIILEFLRFSLLIDLDVDLNILESKIMYNKTVVFFADNLKAWYSEKQF